MIIIIDKMAKKDRINDNIITGYNNVLEELQNLRMKQYRMKCNIIWGIVVVILLLCAFGSFLLQKISSNDVVMAVTNFATILSIILSISSIAYSYSTSHDTARQFAEIDKTVAQMKENNEEIKRHNTDMLNFVIEISKEVHTMHEFSFTKHSIDLKANNDKELRSPVVKGNIEKNNSVQKLAENEENSVRNQCSVESALHQAR